MYTLSLESTKTATAVRVISINPLEVLVSTKDYSKEPLVLLKIKIPY